MQQVTISTTKKKEIVDITDKILRFLEKKKDASICFLFIKHTTAALTTADLDPGTDLDMLDAFEAIIPKLSYRHPHNPAHVPDHIMSSIIGSSIVIPVSNGKLTLGTWQRVVLVELDGPRERELVIQLL
ncbi:MAG TPA: secondary thiamine-phosphate synthase enzyme YjbQ [Candidatus Saccharimonadales bacterium]|nr:secondary thiamine-phosphate synthase enzyme YjbQ [Candidatus Saccharimonadales bacterium]